MTIADPPVFRSRRAYWLWFAGPAVILILSCVMSTTANRRVMLPGWGLLPETCTVRTRLGFDCPGCGLTRCFIHLAHGNLHSAWQLNPIGLLLFAFVLLQLPLALGKLAEPRLSRKYQMALARITPWNELFLVVLLLALLVRWSALFVMERLL